MVPIVDNNELKLFDLAADSGERIDVSAKYPEKVKELKNAYIAWCEANISK